MNTKDSILISQVTDAKPNACNCPNCQALCTITPCIGTPEDIANLLTEGLARFLVRTEWHAGRSIGIPVIEMVQLNAHECGRCPLFQGGLCLIHPIKPTGGKLASHTPTDLARNPDTAVALTWLAPHNRELVANLLSLFP